MHLADQGMLLLVRSTLVRMMALSAATHCFKTLRSETVESRQKHCLALQYNLALCTVGALHPVETWLPCICLCANASIMFAIICCHTCMLYHFEAHIDNFGTKGFQAHLAKQVLLSTLPVLEDKVPHLKGH